jgi:hypothetical protein
MAMKTLIEPLKPDERKDNSNVLPLFRNDEVRQTLHNMMNQLTVINLTCFKISSARRNDSAIPALPEIQLLESTAEELMQLSQQLTEQFNQLTVAHRPQALLRAPKSRRNANKVCRLFK